MNKQKLIKEKGYEIVVTSWENDADNYRTVSEQGLPEQFTLSVLYPLCLRHRSSGNVRDSHNMGNMGRGQHIDTLADALDGILSDKADMQAMKQHFDDMDVGPIDYDDLHDISEALDECYLWNLIGMWGEGEYVRVVESVEVYFHPEDVYATQVL